MRGVEFITPNPDPPSRKTEKLVLQGFVDYHGPCVRPTYYGAWLSSANLQVFDFVALIPSVPSIRTGGGGSSTLDGHDTTSFEKSPVKTHLKSASQSTTQFNTKCPVKRSL